MNHTEVLIDTVDKIINFDVVDMNGTPLTCQASASNAVKVILGLVGLTGAELLTFTDDWREYEWGKYSPVYTSTQIVEIDIDQLGNEVHFEHTKDISQLISSGEWCIVNGNAFSLPRIPRVRRRLKRSDFSKIRSVIKLIKLRRLFELGRVFSKQSLMLH